MSPLPDFRPQQRFGELRAADLQQLRKTAERADNLRVGPGLGLRVTPTDKIISLLPKEPRLVPGIDAAVERFLLLDHGHHPADYLICKRSGDDGLPEGPNVLIAKPWEVQKTPFHHQNIDGIVYFYSELNATFREGVEELTGAREKQAVIPRWHAGTPIIAVKPVNGTGVFLNPVTREQPIEWQDLNNSRAFARLFDQTYILP